MNTQHSKHKSEQFLEKGRPHKRKTLSLEKRFSFPPDKVFFQFCPSRELDWIEGWECDLVFTTTGYAEPDCIFTTPETSLLGPGVWIFTRYEPNQRLELVRLINDAVVIHFRIHLQDHNDGTCTGTWHLTFTGLNQEGDTMVEALPDEMPELKQAVESLEYYLKTGEMMTV